MDQADLVGENEPESSATFLAGSRELIRGAIPHSAWRIPDRPLIDARGRPSWRAPGRLRPAGTRRIGPIHSDRACLTLAGYCSVSAPLTRRPDDFKKPWITARVALGRPRLGVKGYCPV